MLDFDELQEFPKISSWATKSDFISDVMGTQNHQKTLYESWLQGSLCMGIWWQVDYQAKQPPGANRRVVRKYGMWLLLLFTLS